MSEFPTDLLRFLLNLEAVQSTIAGPTISEPPTISAPPTSPTLPPTDSKPQKRCGASTCKHKLLLSDMACRCGIRHCGNHRLPETHNCTYDHKQREKKVLETQVVACVADKMGDRI